MRLGGLKRKSCLSLPDEITHRHEPFTSVGGSFHGGRFDATHWFVIGDPRATDRSIMEWARSNGHIVFTHDLDFGAILAATQASGPSVIQIPANNVLPEEAGVTVIAAIRRFRDVLEQGALISVDPQSARVRILPLGR